MAEPELPPFRAANLTAFQQGGLLWAVNEFVLWPLGLALTVNVDMEDGKLVVSGPIDIREWHADDGHIETIEDDSDQPDFDRWLAFCATAQDRLSKMPIAERTGAAQRLARLGVAASMQTGHVLATTTTRPQWKWVEEDGSVQRAPGEGSPGEGGEAP